MRNICGIKISHLAALSGGECTRGKLCIRNLTDRALPAPSLSLYTFSCATEAVLSIGLAAAIHASAYIHGEERKHFPRFWIGFVSTILSMSAVILVEGKLPFLVAWEAMALASAGLVAFESTKKSVKKAVWIYLLACHAGGGGGRSLAKSPWTSLPILR